MTTPKKILHWILFLLPFAALTVWMAQYAQKSLHWDDWGLVENRFPTDDLKPNFAGLFSPSQGHLIPILLVSVIPAILLAEGDPRFLVAACLLLAFLSGRLLVQLAKDTTTGGESTRPCLSGGETLLISLAVACPLYGNSWTWWICWPIFVPFACVLISVWLLNGRRASFTWGKLAIITCLSVIAALSHGSGGLVWMAVLPCLAAALIDSPRRVRWSALAIHLAAGLIVFWPFLAQALTSPSGEAKPSVGLGKMISYALTLAGGNLGQGLHTDPLIFSRVLGALLCLGAAAIFLHALHPRTDRGQRVRLLPWLSVMLFGLLSVAAIAAGRSVLPDQQALGGRYLLLTYPIWLGLYFSIRILLKEGAAGRSAPNRERLLTAVTVFVIALQANAWFEGYRVMRLHHASQLNRAAAVNFLRIFPRNPDLLRSFVEIEPLLRVAERLDRHDKLAGFRLFQTDDLAELGPYRTLKPQSGGQLTLATTDDTGRIVLEGYAYLAESDRPSDLIILSWETNPESPPRMFCLVPMVVRDDFYHSFERHRRPERFTQWRIRLHPGQFPPGTVTVRAWAFDHEKKRRHLLPNSVTLQDGIIKTFHLEAPSREEIGFDKMWPVAPGT